VSHLLETLARGLNNDLGDLLDRYFWSPPSKDLSALRKACLEHPEWPDIHLHLGLAHLRSVRIDDAIEQLKLACRCKPDYLAARVALAAAYYEKRDHARMLDELRIANQNHPGEPPILFAMGFCLEALQRTAEAAEYYRDTVARDPQFVPARERLAATAVFLDELPEAIEQYQELVKSQPQQTWLRSALGHLYFRSGRYDEAVEEFENAIAMEPENWSLVDDEVESLVADGLVREAIERLHTLIARQGSFADLHVRLADLYSQIGDDDGAMKHYRLALDIQPDYLEANVKLGTHHLICGRWEQAAEAFDAACAINERTLVNYVGMGVAHGACGRSAEAMNCFEMAAAVEPNSTLLLVEMSRLQLRASVAREFARSFDAGQSVPVAEIDLDNDDLLQRQIERHAEEVENRPHHADVRYRYGVLLRSEGRLGEAIEQFAEAVRINPTYVQAIIKLGVTQQELGHIEEAIETFQSALAIEPRYVDLHYRLGLLFTDARQFAEAVRHMEAASQGAADNQCIRAGLALSLQNMGLMDRAAATWRSLCKLHHATARSAGTAEH